MKEIKIHKTKNYSLFKDITSNREVDQRHVNNLCEAIRQNNLLHLNPIICNSQYQVIDGQHRIEAAKKLKLEIYYLIDDKIEKKHIAGLNSNQKNWSVLDYVNYFTVERVPEYQVLSEFINKYSWVPVTTLLQLLSGTGKRDTKAFKEGKIDVSNREECSRILLHIQDIRNIGVSFAYDRNFILAIRDIFQIEGYKPDQMIEKLKIYRLEIEKAAKKEHYLKQLEPIYNKNKYQQNKLRFF